MTNDKNTTEGQICNVQSNQNNKLNNSLMHIQSSLNFLSREINFEKSVTFF